VIGSQKIQHKLKIHHKLVHIHKIQVEEIQVLYIQQQAAAPTQTISGVQIESPAQKFYNQQQQTGQLSFQSDYDKARQQVNGLLGSPSSVGLLAVNESPFYGFLKSNNLNRRIL
jgi:hypothetical protein